jgi:glycerophosphoryl diester phosphodiesterase
LLSHLPQHAIIAHRGSSAYAPENTLAACTLALKQGADAIEIDVKLTKDNHVVVIHDQTVDRTTQGHGKVRELTLSEIRKLDAGSHFDVAFKDEPIPLLEEIIKAVGQLTYINIELTNYGSPLDNLPLKVAELIKQYNLSNRVLISSFNPIALIRIGKHLPKTPLALLALPGWKGYFARSFPGMLFPYESINIDKSDATDSFINKIHSRGKKVLVYTVNNKYLMHSLFSMDADGIFTDDPILARQSLFEKEGLEKH